MFNRRACVAQWIARLPPKEKVVGSNPTSGVRFDCFKSFEIIYSNKGGCSSNGRAPASHAGGTGIDTLLLHLLFQC